MTSSKPTGLATGNYDLLGDMICCPGLDYCNLANARSIPIAKEIAKRFEDPKRQELIGPLRLNMSGCINACGHHHSGNIGILGVDKKGTELYQISLGGSPKDDAAVGTIIGPGFRAEAVPEAIDTIVSTYLANRNDGETSSPPGAGSVRRPSRRLSMALLDLATRRARRRAGRDRDAARADRRRGGARRCGRRQWPDRSPSASPPSATAAAFSLAVLLARASRLQGRDQGRRLSDPRPRAVPAALGLRHRRDHRCQ